MTEAGKDRLLPSVNGLELRERDSSDAPTYMSAEAAYGWACGYNQAQALLVGEVQRLQVLVEAHTTVAALRVHACTAGAGQSVSPSGTVKSWHQPCPSCQRLTAARDILRASS